MPQYIHNLNIIIDKTSVERPIRAQGTQRWKETLEERSLLSETWSARAELEESRTRTSWSSKLFVERIFNVTFLFCYFPFKKST